MLKLAVPTVFEDARYWGQVAYGTDELPTGGREAVAHKWTAVTSQQHAMAVTCINNGTYGSDLTGSEMRLSLLRSPGYSALPGGNKPDTMAKDRFSNRIDQGERSFTFWLNGGDMRERMDGVDREALACNEKPYALSYFPSGTGAKAQPLVTLSDEVIQLTAFKKAESSGDYIIRLFEPTGMMRSTTVRLPFARVEQLVELGKFEIKTLRFIVSEQRLTEEPLMENEA
jgi:alpha-mannosidase